MEGNRRAILFALLVTLSSVRGGDFTFYEYAYNADLNLERASGINFVKRERVSFVNMNEEQEWVVDPGTVREGRIPMRKLIPRNPHLMSTGVKGVENHGQDVEILSYMLMSFHIADHKIGSSSGVAQDHQTAYGKLAMCFQNPTNLQQSETCFYTLMFSPPVAQPDKIFADINMKKINPISDTQMSQITQNEPFLWKLEPLKSIFKFMEKAVLSSRESSSSTSLKTHLQRGETAFYVTPIIVEEDIILSYYAWVSTR